MGKASVLKVSVASSCSYRLFLSFSTFYSKFSFTTGREISNKSKNIRLPVKLSMWSSLTNLWLSQVADVDVNWVAGITMGVRRLNIFFCFFHSRNLWWAQLASTVCDSCPQPDMGEWFLCRQFGESSQECPDFGWREKHQNNCSPIYWKWRVSINIYCICNSSRVGFVDVLWPHGHCA